MRRPLLGIELPFAFFKTVLAQSVTMSRPSSILSLFALLCFTTCIHALQKSCGKNPIDDMDELISSIMPFGNPKVNAPTQLEELPKFCR